MDYEKLFETTLAEEEKTFGEKFLERVEEDFEGVTPEALSRKEEREEIREKIKELELKIRKTPNVKNIRLSSINKERSEKRKKYKREIDLLKLRLEEIASEEPSK